MASLSQTIGNKVVLFIQIFSTVISSYFVMMKWKNQTSSIWVSPIDLDMNLKTYSLLTNNEHVKNMLPKCNGFVYVFQWYKKIWFGQTLPHIILMQTFENLLLGGNLTPALLFIITFSSRFQIENRKSF